MTKYRIEIVIDVDDKEWGDDDLNKITIGSFFEFGAEKFKEQYKGVNSAETSISKL